MSEEERERLLKACGESSDSRLFLLVVLAVSTGARKGELLGLRWRDIDLKRQVAVLHETKNDERRALPLSGVALETLVEYSRVHAPRWSLAIESNCAVWSRCLLSGDVERESRRLRGSQPEHFTLGPAQVAERVGSVREGVVAALR